MDDLYNLVYGTYNNGGGTQLFNALVRGGIDSLEKFEKTPLDDLKKIRGIGKNGHKRLVYLKNKLVIRRLNDAAMDTYHEFLSVTGIDERKISYYERESNVPFWYGLSNHEAIKVYLTNGATIQYIREKKEDE